MIRREIRFANAEPRWLLVSQVEHARISGLLAKSCLGKFPQKVGAGASVDGLNRVRKELLETIVHHDDGWAAWEAEPQFDERGRPLSFRELPLTESMPIWTASIETAAQLGGLAGWLVSGHFLVLLESSEKVTHAAAVEAWQAEMNARRAQWLERWQQVDPPLHSHALAAEALAWLQLLDVMSLWLCSVCPGGGERITEWPESYRVGPGCAGATEFSCGEPGGFTERLVDAERCEARIDPWRFDVDELAIDATGWTVPVREYRSAAELHGAMSSHRLSWLLLPKE